jgi:membrane protein
VERSLRLAESLLPVSLSWPRVTPNPPPLAEPPKLYQNPAARIVEVWRPTMRYCMETEVHVFALSMAASVLLSAFPFLIVMMSLCKYGLHWPAGVQALDLALGDFFPGDMGQFIRRNLTAVVQSRGPFQITSLFLLLLTANGVFEPLEVALNRAWRVPKNRSYLRNQIVSLGLIFLCGSLTLISFVLTAVNRQIVSGWFPVPAFLGLLLFKIAAVPISILALGFMYWLLPNRKIAPAGIVPVAILVGLALELLKYLNLLTWPFLKAKLQKEYGPFYISVTIVLWSFAAAMVILAGAEWSARRKL